MGQVTYTAVIDACVKEAEKSFASPVSALLLHCVHVSGIHRSCLRGERGNLRWHQATFSAWWMKAKLKPCWKPQQLETRSHANRKGLRHSKKVHHCQTLKPTIAHNSTHPILIFAKIMLWSRSLVLWLHFSIFTVIDQYINPIHFRFPATKFGGFGPPSATKTLPAQGPPQTWWPLPPSSAAAWGRARWRRCWAETAS